MWKIVYFGCFIQEFQCREPCLYLTLKSFTHPYYFLGFLSTRENLANSSNFKFLQDVFSKFTIVSADAVIMLIHTVSDAGKNLKVFIDFSKVCAFAINDYLDRLLQIATISITGTALQRYTPLLAVLSGLSAARTIHSSHL